MAVLRLDAIQNYIVACRGTALPCPKEVYLTPRWELETPSWELETSHSPQSLLKQRQLLIRWLKAQMLVGCSCRYSATGSPA